MSKREIEFRLIRKNEYYEGPPIVGYEALVEREIPREDSIDGFRWCGLCWQATHPDGEVIEDCTKSIPHDFKDQYTGLRDKKRTPEYPEGQKIYEGDIISKAGAYILWSNRLACWCFNFKESTTPEVPLFFEKTKDLEVFGNVHTHPHLLGKESDNEQD